MSNAGTKTETNASAGVKSKNCSGGNPRKNNSNKQQFSKKKQASGAAKKSPHHHQQQQPDRKPSQQPVKRRHTPPGPAVDPPLECSRVDFEALLGDASGLADSVEAGAELLDCARYGEVDACRAILDVWSKKENNKIDDDGETMAAITDAIDASRSTPLHKACANGHASTVQLLLSRGARHVQNESGNTPLHWAAGAGHAMCVRLLLDHYDAAFLKEKEGSGGGDDDDRKVDVLLKNVFGRSALTEGFASGDTKTVEHLLNHDSAEEEKLIGGLKKKDVEDEKEADYVAEGVGGEEVGDEKVEKKTIVHEFDFLRGDDKGKADREDGKRPLVSIRELPIAHADDPFGQAPIEDTTGLGIWCASIVMARWLASPSMVERMRDTTVLELGAGCGIPALTAAIYGRPKSVTITDLNPETIENIRHNIELNLCDGSTTASSINWGDEATYPLEKLDYVVCSDCIYQSDIVPLLKKVVAGLLDPDRGTFLYVAPEGGRDGLPEFVAAMKSEGFKCVREEIAPEAYRENPLKSGDEEDCFLHFHELASTLYVLYEFKRC